MHVYFLFDIKDEFKSLYENNLSSLYLILKQIYFTEKDEIEYVYPLYRQLINPIDKNLLDREIFIKCHRYVTYSKREDKHYINNLYYNEMSKLLINNTYILLVTEQLSSTFFKVLKNYNNYLACDFKNNRFFYLFN